MDYELGMRLDRIENNITIIMDRLNELFDDESLYNDEDVVEFDKNNTKIKEKSGINE